MVFEGRVGLCTSELSPSLEARNQPRDNVNMSCPLTPSRTVQFSHVFTGYVFCWLVSQWTTVQQIVVGEVCLRWSRILLLFASPSATIFSPSRNRLESTWDSCACPVGQRCRWACQPRQRACVRRRVDRDGWLPRMGRHVARCEQLTKHCSLWSCPPRVEAGCFGGYICGPQNTSTAKRSPCAKVLGCRPAPRRWSWWAWLDDSDNRLSPLHTSWLACWRSPCVTLKEAGASGKSKVSVLNVHSPAQVHNWAQLLAPQPCFVDRHVPC